VKVVVMNVLVEPAENEVKSRSMTEAYDAGERREIAMRTKAEADEVLIGQESTFRTTATGVRYKDQSLGQGAEVCVHRYGA
jgi:hypothetical protein